MISKISEDFAAENSQVIDTMLVYITEAVLVYFYYFPFLFCFFFMDTTYIDVLLVSISDCERRTPKTNRTVNWFLKSDLLILEDLIENETSIETNLFICPII